MVSPDWPSERDAVCGECRENARIAEARCKQVNRVGSEQGIATYATMPWGVGMRVASRVDVICTARQPHFAFVDWRNPLTWFRKRFVSEGWNVEYRVTLPDKGQELIVKMLDVLKPKSGG